MNRIMAILLFAAACSGGNPGPQNDGMRDPGDLAGAAQNNDMMTSPAGGQCPCGAGDYCDLATNTCKVGCAFDTDCQTAHCNVATHQCFTPGVTCGGQMCTGGQVCCVSSTGSTCAASCPANDMGVITASCAGPSDCTSGAQPLCCAHLTFGPSPGCSQTAVVQCAASCATSIPLATCSTTGEAVVCQQKSDCQDPQNANCCMFPQISPAGAVCVNDQFAGFGTCLE
jgi:hypothetical protein